MVNYKSETIRPENSNRTEEREGFRGRDGETNKIFEGSQDGCIKKGHTISLNQDNER